MKEDFGNGKPVNKSYLECNFSAFLQKSIFERKYL